MQCLEICLAGFALLAAGHAAPWPHAVQRPQDKRSVAAPDAGLRRLAAAPNGFGLFDFGGGGSPPSTYYHPGDAVPLPFAAAGFDGFGGVPATQFDLAAAAATAGFAGFQYPAGGFGFDTGYPFLAPAHPAPSPTADAARPAAQAPDSAVRALPAVDGAADAQPATVPYPAADVPPDHSFETRPPQQQLDQRRAPAQSVTPSDVPEPALELRPPPYSDPSENAYGPSDAQSGPSDAQSGTTQSGPAQSGPAQSGPAPTTVVAAGDASRGAVHYESVPSVSYSLPPTGGDDLAAPAAAPPTDRPAHGKMVIVVSDSLFGGESDGPGRVAVDSDPGRGPPPPAPQQESQQPQAYAVVGPPPPYAHSNQLSANSYGESNSVQPDPFRGAGGPKIVISASDAISGNGKREQPAVRYLQRDDDDDGHDDDGYPSNVTPRD